MYDFQHASRLYRDDNLYDYAPKAGWMYYVRLGINPKINSLLDKTWQARYKSWIGLMAKSADLPKFNITTETLNQYNRKTVIQSKLNYSPVTITFHDDMANATTELWKNYYKYYFTDSTYATNKTFNAGDNSHTLPEYGDTKYKQNGAIAYGLANGVKEPFFNSIDIYLLNKKKFTSITLINPIIKGWEHSSVDQTSDSKMMESKMTVEFETVIYDKGKAKKLDFADTHYDRTASPLGIGGQGGLLGTISGASDVFGDLAAVDSNTSPFELLGIGLKAASVAAGAAKITKESIKAEAYSVVAGIGKSYTGGRGFSTTELNNAANASQNLYSGAVNLFSRGNPSVNNGTTAGPVKP
jgi:hypothetical protein